MTDDEAKIIMRKAVDFHLDQRIKRLIIKLIIDILEEHITGKTRIAAQELLNILQPGNDRFSPYRKRTPEA